MKWKSAIAIDYQALKRRAKTSMATRLLRPIHAGEILREEFMVPMELSSIALSRATGVAPARVNDIVNGKRDITTDTALRLGRCFGTTADVWINLQKRFELEAAPRDLGNTLKKIHPRAA